MHLGCACPFRTKYPWGDSEWLPGLGGGGGGGGTLLLSLQFRSPLENGIFEAAVSFATDLVILDWEAWWLKVIISTDPLKRSMQ